MASSALASGIMSLLLLFSGWALPAAALAMLGIFCGRKAKRLAGGKAGIMATTGYICSVLGLVLIIAALALALFLIQGLSGLP